MTPYDPDFDENDNTLADIGLTVEDFNKALFRLNAKIQESIRISEQARDRLQALVQGLTKSND